MIMMNQDYETMKAVRQKGAHIVMYVKECEAM